MLSGFPALSTVAAKAATSPLTTLRRDAPEAALRASSSNRKPSIVPPRSCGPRARDSPIPFSALLQAATWTSSRTALRKEAGRAAHPQDKTSFIHVNAGLGGDVSSAARGIAHAIIGRSEMGVNLAQASP